MSEEQKELSVACQSLGDWTRTHTCGELTGADNGAEVCLMGWVQYRRDHGGLIFVDLRDRFGLTQIVFSPEYAPEAHEQAGALRSEYVLAMKGKVRPRPEGMVNPNLKTGEVEVVVSEWKLLNTSKTPPFQIEDRVEAGENLRLQWRYLDLRRPRMARNLALRSRTAMAIRNELASQGFLEVETPILTKSTPEGARDYLVPSRLNHGQFYALPQSPQQFKQFCMIAGLDRYFQIARCFRDEDLRADRQPEFTQIDCEMSFVEQEDVLEIFERWAKHMFREVMGIELTEPLRRMPWIEAMEKYGSDKPDLRFGMEFADLTDLAKGHGFQVFDDAEYVTGFAATGCAAYTRKQIDALTEFVKRQQIGAKGLIWIRVEQEGVKSSVDKFYTPDEIRKMAGRCGAKAGDMVFILCGKKFKTLTQLCALRLEVAQQLGLRDPKKFAPLWIVDFPLFEWDDETQRYYAMHHPFTSPKPEDVQYIDSDPGRVRANAYDFVCNGTEIGGGSIRIHDSKLQAKMFEVLGFTAEQAQLRFGFLMDAFKYGAPPHGGLAFGFDRLCSLFGGSDSIRDYIAFPKNNAGRDVMLDAPGCIDQAQLDELCLSLVKPEE